MQINLYRFKNSIVFLCGLCLSLSVFYSRGLITYALPAVSTFNIDLVNRGNIALSNGSIEYNNNKGYFSNYIDISGYDNLSLSSFSYTLYAKNQTNITDMNRINYHYYDKDKKYISRQEQVVDYASYSTSGDSVYPYKAVYVFPSYTLFIPDNAVYMVISLKNNGAADKKANEWIIPEINPCVMSYNYDDGSFNVGIYGVGGVRFPLNVSGSYKDYNGEFPYYGSDVLLTGSANSLQNSYVTLSGFDKAYYDLDLYINIDIIPQSKTLNNPNVVITGQFDKSGLTSPLLQCSYPNVVVTSIPKELNYKIGDSTIYGTAIQYEAKNINNNGVNYVWDSSIKSKSSVELHIYGTTYISNEFTIGLLYDALVNCRNFPQQSYQNINQILDFKLQYSVSGIVQKSPHTFGSEIEGLESIDESINNQTNEMIKEHEEEIQKGQETSDELSSSLDNVTSTLTAVEILKLPWTMLKDLYNAIIKDGQTTLTFPSFELMGYTLWESYDFDLNILDTKFTVLFKSLRLISGIIICSAFGMYIRNYFIRLFGGDVEVD